MSVGPRWEEHAHESAAWARAEGHDSYWRVREGFFDEIVPAPGRATLEIGCGEGRVARDLRQRGHRVTGIDTSRTALALAREADPASEYLLADAAALPLADGSFDLVVAYNSLMNIDDVETALGEAARVLAAGGHLAICIVHPLAYAKHMGTYFARQVFEGSFERDGLTLTIVDHVRPLGDYTQALAASSFLIERVREVDPDGPRVPVPDFMFLRCVKRAP